jgi:uncharacterized protein YndB with AHSA1/START domain
MPGPSDDALLIERTIRIRSLPDRVVAAFFDPRDLAAWWDVSNAVTVARPLAPYAIQWSPTPFADAVLGRLGGTLHGMVMDVQAGASFFLADVYYTPPEGAPIGPMALEVLARPIDEGRSTELTIRQSAEDEGERWQRYFTVMADGWDRALDALREYLEWSGVKAARSSPWGAWGA